MYGKALDAYDGKPVCAGGLRPRPGYKVQFQSQSSITYWYNPARQSIVTVQRHAQEYCGQYGNDAVPQAFFDGYSGIDISFICTTSG